MEQSDSQNADSGAVASFDSDFPPLSKTPSPQKPVVSAQTSPAVTSVSTSDSSSSNLRPSPLSQSISASPVLASDSFRAVVDFVDSFSRLKASSSSPTTALSALSLDQSLALSLLIPRLSPFQLSYVSAMANRYFDKVAYADGKKCDELRAQASDISYLNELYTRAFQADQVPDVVCELAQLLPVAQLNLSQQQKQQQQQQQQAQPSQSQQHQQPDCGKLIHLYANMLMHCINRTDDVQMQRVVQALAVLHPDVRDHLLQNSSDQSAVVANGDGGVDDADCDDSGHFSSYNRSPPKIIPPELMLPILGAVQEPHSQSVKKHSPLGVCVSVPAPHRSSADLPQPPQRPVPSQPHQPATATPYYQHPNHGQSGAALTGHGHQASRHHMHVAVSRQRTMPEGSSMVSMARQLQQTPSGQASLQGCVFVMEGSGMRDVPIWLKNLRLHKYTPLFEKMTYEEMLSLTEEWLEANKVTKGATNKILQNIQKLRERQSQLRHYEKELMQNQTVDVKSILDALHQMMNTPIKRYTPPLDKDCPADGGSAEQAVSAASSTSPDNMQWILGDDAVPEGDFPGQMTRLIGRLMCFFLIRSAALGEPSLLVHFIKLVDKCAQHEAFTDRHRTLLSQTKQRCQSFVHASSGRSHFGGGPGGSNSPGAGGMGYRKPRNMQSDIRASPSVPMSITGTRSAAANGLMAEAGYYGPNSGVTNPSSPNRNFWLEQSQATLVGDGPPPQQVPLQTSYSLRSTAGLTPVVSGRPPPHSITPTNSQSSALNQSGVGSVASPNVNLVDQFLPFNPAPSSAAHGQGPPGFANKQFRPAVAGLMSGKAPLGRTQSAPQTPPGGTLLMMSLASRPQPGQAWGPAASQLQQQAANPSSTSPNGAGSFGPPGGHVAVSPQNSSSLHANMKQPGDAVSCEAEAFAQSQLNTLCLQMTDSFLNAPDFSEHDDAVNTN